MTNHKIQYTNFKKKKETPTHKKDNKRGMHQFSPFEPICSNKKSKQERSNRLKRIMWSIFFLRWFYFFGLMPFLLFVVLLFGFNGSSMQKWYVVATTVNLMRVQIRLRWNVFFHTSTFGSGVKWMIKFWFDLSCSCLWFFDIDLISLILSFFIFYCSTFYLCSEITTVDKVLKKSFTLSPNRLLKNIISPGNNWKQNKICIQVQVMRIIKHKISDRLWNQ